VWQAFQQLCMGDKAKDSLKFNNWIFINGSWMILESVNCLIRGVGMSWISVAQKTGETGDP